jgi:hypothetical protein
MYIVRTARTQKRNQSITSLASEQYKYDVYEKALHYPLG